MISLHNQQILVFYKTSTYRHSLQRRKFLCETKDAGKWFQHFYESHAQHYETLERIESVLKSKKLKYVKCRRGHDFDFSKFDLVITVGGDGTVLEAASKMNSNQKILGVNSAPCWSVGRLCACQRLNFKKILEQKVVQNSSWKNLKRLRLNIAGSSVDFLNDILVCHRNPAAMSHYALEVGRKIEVQKSSGIWISTAIGSTGAIHSAGGHRLPKLSSRWQFRARELYRGGDALYKLSEGILSPKQKIKITSCMKHGRIYIDGAHRKLSFGLGQELSVFPSETSLKIILK